MILISLQRGQGLGNQLWNIYAARGIAKKKSLQYRVLNTHHFKCRGFLHPSFSSPNSEYHSDATAQKASTSRYYEPQLVHPTSGLNITEYDDSILEIPKHTTLQGYFQSVSYLSPRSEILQEIGPPQIGFDGCTINIRGGEYRGLPTVLLDRDYYLRAVEYMRSEFGVRHFRIVTDDAKYARKLVPGLPVISSGGVKRVPYLPYVHPASSKIYRDFRSVQESRFQILSNSTFSWWAAYSGRAEEVIAPKFWMAYNENSDYWSTPGSFVDSWNWLGKDGSLLVRT